jgi:hypothetical protein
MRPKMNDVPNRDSPVIPKIWEIESENEPELKSTDQFLVPPMYSGKLNVGLATTAPVKKAFGLDSQGNKRRLASGFENEKF